MNKLDKAISDLGADAAISTSLHIKYLISGALKQEAKRRADEKEEAK